MEKTCSIKAVSSRERIFDVRYKRMGCLPSKIETRRARSKRRQKPRIAIKEWSSNSPITKQQLDAQREEFWDTQPYYGGNKGISRHSPATVSMFTLVVVWETLKAVVEADMDMKPVLIDSAGLIIGSSDLTVFYDETGKQLAPFTVLRWKVLMVQGGSMTCPDMLLATQQTLANNDSPWSHDCVRYCKSHTDHCKTTVVCHLMDVEGEKVQRVILPVNGRKARRSFEAEMLVYRS